MNSAVILLVLFLFQPHSILNKVKSGTSEKEQELLSAITVEDQLTPTLLPVKTVGVQVRNSTQCFRGREECL